VVNRAGVELHDEVELKAAAQLEAVEVRSRSLPSSSGGGAFGRSRSADLP
jgi:hypothetical protein